VRFWHRNLYLASVLFFFIPFWPVLYLLGKHSSKNYSHLVCLRRIIASMASAFVGIKYKIKYEKEIDWSKNYIICANHTSNLDITAIMKACPIDFSFIGKAELLENPVTGFFFKTIDIPVNRSSKVSSFRAFKRAGEYLQLGKSIAIFPEGGIADNYPPSLQAFKNGGFKLAFDLDIPVLPVIIENAWELYWDDAKLYGSKAGYVNIRVLEPLLPSQYNESAENLRDITFDLFKKHLDKQKP